MATAYQVIKGIVVTVVSLAVWYFISTHLKFEIDIVTELPDKSLSMSGLRLPKSPFAQVAVCPRSPFAQLGETATWANGDVNKFKLIDHITLIYWILHSQSQLH